jgi:hypothetical protein
MAPRKKSPQSLQLTHGNMHTGQSDDLFGSGIEPTIPPARNLRISEGRPTIRKDGQFACAVCGDPAHFGFGVKLLAGQLGSWACSEHRDEVKLSSPSVKTTP